MPRGIPGSGAASQSASYQNWRTELTQLYGQFQNHIERGLAIPGVPPTLLAEGGIMLSRFAGMMIGVPPVAAASPRVPAASRTTTAASPAPTARAAEVRDVPTNRGTGRGRTPGRASTTKPAPARQRFRLRAEERQRGLTIPQAMQDRINKGETVSKKLREQYLDGNEARTGTTG